MQPAAADAALGAEDARTEASTPILFTAREHHTRDATGTSGWEKSGYGSLHGLRGVLALWVAVGHLCYGTPWRLNLGNNAAMPFFFIVSGFVLVEAYGHERWARLTWTGRPQAGCEGNVFNSQRFLWRRASRMAPVYYLTNLAGFFLALGKVAGNWSYVARECPDVFRGHEGPRIAVGAANTALMVGTWLPLPGMIAAFNEVSWFVSSIFFCYLIFPWLLPFLQSCSRPVLQHWIWGAIMLQLALVALGYVWFNDVLGFDSVAWHCGNGWDAWVLAYKHPLYNLPHFVLGILGGLLRKAGPSLLGTSSEAPQSSACDAYWASMVYCLTTVIATAVVAFMLCTFWFEEQWSPQTLYFVPLLGQSLLGVPALLAVFGLTADGGMSVASHVLQHPATQWLGGISYSLYLTHWIVKRLALGAFGAPETPSYPPWMVPPLLAVALPLAWLMTSIVEDPTRKWLCCLTEPDGAATPSGSAWGSYGSAMNFAGDIDTQKQPHQDEGDKL